MESLINWTWYVDKDDGNFIVIEVKYFKKNEYNEVGIISKKYPVPRFIFEELRKNGVI